MLFAYAKNKDAEKLRANRAADQRLCFCYTDSGHILIHGVESWSGVEPWSGVVFLELVFWSQCKSFKVRDD